MGTLATSPVSELRVKMQRSHQLEMQLLDLIEKVTLVLATKVENEGAVRDPGQSNLSLVKSVLRAAGGRAMTARQIADATGLDAGSVRMVLYTNKEAFAAEKLSPRRVLWRLSPQENH